MEKIKENRETERKSDASERRRLEAIARLEKIGAVFNKAKTRIIRVIPM